MSGSPSAAQSFWGRYRNEIGLLIAIAVVLLITIQFDDSYRRNPIQTITENLRQVSLLGTFSLGVAIVIIAGGIDLSAGTMIAFTSSVCALTTQALAPRDEFGGLKLSDVSDLHVWIGIAVAITVGTLIGSWHAWLINVVKLPPFVATLATLVGLRSLTILMNDTITSKIDRATTSINVYAPLFSTLRSWWVPFIVFIALSVVIWILMNRTVLGRHLYAIGGNEQAARLSGINIEKLKWIAYSISAFTSSIAGVLYLSYTSGVTPTTTGMGYELNAIAATVVGGCSLQGGVGLIPGVILGVIFLQLVIDAVGRILDSRSTDWTGLIVGLLVVLAVAFNELRKGGAGGRKQWFPGTLGWVVIPFMSVVSGLIAMISDKQHRAMPALIVGGILLVALTARKIVESRRAV